MWDVFPIRLPRLSGGLRAGGMMLAIAALMTANGCARESSTFTSELPLCPQTVTLSVDGGTEPQISWEPACRVWSVQVAEAGSGVVRWHLVMDDESLRSPVRYGAVPFGAGELVSASPLAAGQEYRIRITQRSHGGRVLATTTFTP
jgi:hypothetical protein